MPSGPITSPRRSLTDNPPILLTRNGLSDVARHLLWRFHTDYDYSLIITSCVWLCIFCNQGARELSPMESVVLLCNPIPPKLAEISYKPKIIFKKSPQKIADSHLIHLSNEGRLSEAISILDSIVEGGSKVKPSILSQLIDSCTDSHSLALCYELHSRIKRLLKVPDAFIGTKIVSMFAKCGSLDDALTVFDELQQRNLYTWSAIIGACSREKKWSEVLRLFYSMIVKGNVVPDEFLFPKILQACGNCGDVKTGKLIHAIAIKRGMSANIRVNNSIIAVYAKCGLLDSAKRLFEGMEVCDRVSWNAIITGYCHKGNVNEAHRLFDLMREQGVEPDTITWNILISSCNQLGQCDVAMKLRNEMESSGIKPDVFTCTSMILGLVQNNRRIDALKLFRDMFINEIEPNAVTLMSAITACAYLKDFRKGKEVHLIAVKLGYGENVLVGNSLIDMYSKCGKLDVAREVFDMISEKDVYTWNSMIGGYSQAGLYGVAHDLFKQMRSLDVLPNVVTWNIMITGYIQSGDEEQALDLFERMEDEGGVERDTASWNALIAGFSHHGEKGNALRFFRKMQFHGVKPNSVTILSILPACADLISAKKLKEIHCFCLRSNISSQASVANSLIDTYAKSGNIAFSKAIFDEMPLKDIITWNSLISGYVLHGRCGEAFKLFRNMVETKQRPNRGTFACLLSAYAQAKMVDEGKQTYKIMAEEYKILPCLDHCGAMVNLYGRSGKLDEAFDFIESMGIEPDVSIWSALLTACCVYKNFKMAIHAGEKLLNLEPENASVHTLVMQMYESCGISKDLLKVKWAGIKKNVGWSRIECKNLVYTFHPGDELDGKSLHDWIKSVKLKNKASKHHVPYEETERASGIHSEKVALGFSFIDSCQASRVVRIVNNLRMCENCHRFAELVSKTHECEIYISDSKCLHHFNSGFCSCGGYW